MGDNETNKIPLLRRKSTAAIIFIVPAVLFLIIFSLVPIIYSFWISLQSYNTSMAKDTIHFIGLGNYLSVAADPNYWRSAGWTLIFTVSAVALNVIFGMVLAVLLTSKPLGRAGNIGKSLFALPMMIAPIVTATIWKLVFSPIYGVLNGILVSMGLERVNWLAEALPARIALIIVEVWATTPLCMLIFIAALQTVPEDTIEAGRIDGAGWTKRFLHIILPQIRNYIALVVTLRFMDAIRMFDIVYTLTNGGPGNATETMASTIYKTAFRYFNAGKGSAGAFIFFIFIAIVSLTLTRVMQRPEN